MKLRILLVIAIALALSAALIGLIYAIVPMPPTPKPDARLDQICWQVDTAIGIYTEMKKSPDPALSSTANTALVIYQPLDAICRKKPEKP